MLERTVLPAVLGAALLACAVPTEAFLRGPSASTLRAGHGGVALSTLRCQAPQSSLPLAISRRAALLTGTGLLGQVLIGNPLATVADGQIPQVPSDGREHNVVLTGANSGIGKDAAIKLAAGGYNVYVACRTLAKAQEAKDDIDKAAAALAANGQAGKVTPLVCDLASLDSVRSFSEQWKQLGKTLDVLVLNAGVAPSTALKPPAPRTKDGFEVTVGTNHLGHFLLANLLLPELEAAPGSPRLVITASQVHDPSSAGGNVGSKATLGDLSGLASGRDWEMVDGGAFDPDKAYKDSKLCNVMFTREMARRLKAKGSKVTCNSFSPGLITRTGLFRDQASLFVTLFDFAVYNLFHVAETVSFGGDCLVTMATSQQLEGASGVFWSNSKPGKHTFEQVGVSKEAEDAAEAAKLWDLSAKAVGLSTTL